MAATPGTLEIVRQQIAEYAKPSLTGEPSYLTQSADSSVFTVIDVSTVNGKHSVDTSLAVRILSDLVIIEHDINDKPLVDALVQAGILRDKIVLAYAGESVPTTA